MPFFSFNFSVDQADLYISNDTFDLIRISSFEEKVCKKILPVGYNKLLIITMEVVYSFLFSPLTCDAVMNTATGLGNLYPAALTA